jgi:acetoacetyl-CoA synthetase
LDSVDGPPNVILADGSMPGARWYPGTRVNYAEHMLRGEGLADNALAVLAESQTREPTAWTLSCAIK